MAFKGCDHASERLFEHSLKGSKVHLLFIGFRVTNVFFIIVKVQFPPGVILKIVNCGLLLLTAFDIMFMWSFGTFLFALEHFLDAVLVVLVVLIDH
jgi:hypothetical protein